MNAAKSHPLHTLSMNAGEDENSYTRNSRLQRRVITQTQPILCSTIREILKCMACIPDCFRTADLGCATGSNVVPVIQSIISVVSDVCQEKNCCIPDFEFTLNDNRNNDFNAAFKFVLDFFDELGEGKQPFFLSGVPKSFYSRLFSERRLHFVHSSYSIHWLSKVPDDLEENKGNTYIGRTSPRCVQRAYAKQFENDFSNFLRLRSAEIVRGGSMLLTLIGRRSPDPSSIDCCHFSTFLTNSLLELVGEGLVRAADLDSFNMPFYGPCVEEVLAITGKEGSFKIRILDTFDFILGWCKKTQEPKTGEVEANSIRAGMENMLVAHFGKTIIESLFQRLAKQVAEHVCSAAPKTTINIVLSLVKN